jgi:spermidine synthase
MRHHNHHALLNFRHNGSGYLPPHYFEENKLVYLFFHVENLVKNNIIFTNRNGNRMNIKKFLSYFTPVNVHQEKSKINTNLEVTWNNGQLVLDSKNTNFSYGNLQKVLRFGLQKIGFENIINLKDILVLGVAGGSVIKTLVDEIQFNGKITGVEIDEITIELANQYFSLDEIKNLEVIIDDAQNFVQTTNEKFDLIIIDIFQDHIMPGFLFEKEFTTHISNILKEKGTVLFNTIVSYPRDQVRNDKYIENFDLSVFDIIRFSKIEGDNELIIFAKS